MAEQHAHAYSTLFEVRLLHHYWLDEGKTLFGRLPDEKQKPRLLNYDIGVFLEIAPTPRTGQMLKTCRAFWSKTKTGFIVATSGEALIPAGTVLEWSLRVIDPDFFNYTAQTLRPQAIRECYTADKSARYRFRENVPVFTNLTGASRGSGENKMLYLSREIAPLDAGEQAEALFDLDGALCQLTADQSGETPVYQTLDADKAAMPAFASQRDVPEIMPPAGVTDAPSRGILLDDGVSGDLFAMVRIAAARGDDGDFSIIDSEGKPLASAPVFHLRLQNRRTWWRWIGRDGSESLSAEPLPLTFYGNASGTQGIKPSVSSFRAEPDGENAVARLVSEIFI